MGNVLWDTYCIHVCNICTLEFPDADPDRRNTHCPPGINVPRSRFLPVKKTSDLLLVMSNLYALQAGSLVMSPLRMFPTTPHVKLGDKHFNKVSATTKTP